MEWSLIVINLEMDVWRRRGTGLSAFSDELAFRHDISFGNE
jgi:hypothetical protein